MGTVSKLKVGRPKLFSSAAEVEKKIDKYIETKEKEEKPLTVAGMARCLGMCSETLNQYSKDPVFTDVIKKAKTRIEQQWEERLANSACTGAIFWLKNHANYRDKTEIGNTDKEGNDVKTDDLDVARRLAYILQKGLKQ